MVPIYVMHHRWNFPCTVPAGDAQIVRVWKQLRIFIGRDKPDRKSRAF